MRIEDRNNIVTRNMGLVGTAIHLFGTGILALNHPVLQYDDLYQIGMLALMKAAEKFDPDKGAFSTFAMRVIKNDFLKELEQVVKIKQINPAQLVSIDEMMENKAEGLLNQEGMLYNEAYTLEDIDSLVSSMHRIQEKHKDSEKYKLGIKITVLKYKGFDTSYIRKTLRLTRKEYASICSMTRKFHLRHRDEFNWIPA